MSSAPAQPATVSPAQPVPVEYDLLCEGCGYSLLGLYSDRCPECGRPFDPSELPLARVPWLYRARLGRLRAYVQTVWMILRRPREFAAEMCRPVRVSAADARSFRRATLRLVIAAYFVAVAVGAAYAIREMIRVGIPIEPLRFFQPAIAYLASAVALWVMLAMATDMPTFIWRGLPSSPDDLGPLHHYACAPLALVPPIAMVCGGALAAYDAFGGRDLAHAVAILTATLVSVCVALIWWIPPVLMRAATRCPPSRMLLLAAYLPVHWLIMFAFAAGVLLAAMSVVDQLTGGSW